MATVAAHPGRVALDDGATRLSYAQLDSEARHLAANLSAAGIGRCDRVGIRVPDGIAELYVAILGTLFAGAAYVPIDVSDSDDRAAEILNAAGAVAVVGEGLDVTAFGTGSNTPGEVEPSDDCWVIFTSGSTGRPKGVAVTHRSAAAFVDAETTLWRVLPDDRVLAALSVGFDASCEEMWLAWRNGAALVPAPRDLVRSGAELGRFVAASGVTVMSSVPTIVSMLEKSDLANVRLLVLGGEACSEQLGWELARGREVWNTYGPTEATVVTTACPICPDERLHIGWPLPGWDVAVVGQDGSPLSCGETGELVVGGVGLARYLDAELDEAGFSAIPELGWTRGYRTGDLVRATHRGIEYVGRNDDQVKIGGRRLELGEIEGRLLEIPGVKQAAAVLRHSDQGHPLLVAYVSGSAEVCEIRQSLLRQLPSGLSPLVVALESFPLKQAGKLDRRALPWPPPPAQHAVEGLTETETFLADAWEEYLGIRAQSRDDDFFELGGASLAAARLASNLRKRFPSFAVAEIYRHRSLGALAARLDRLDNGVSRSKHVANGPAKRGVAQLVAAAGLFLASVPSWVVATFALNDLVHLGLPIVSWPWLLFTWAIFVSSPGRILLLAASRRLLLSRLRPGRYPHRSSVATRVWFVDKLAEQFNIEEHGGTPWAAKVARLTGTVVGRGCRLGSIPSPAGLIRLGSGVTVEADADINGWYFDGGELVIDEVDIASGARIGTRALLMPGASVGERAEVEPASLIEGHVPAGERWAGSPGRRVGRSGEDWPADAAPMASAYWRWAYVASMGVSSFLPLVAILLAYLLVSQAGFPSSLGNVGLLQTFGEALALSATWVVLYALLVAALVRPLGRLLRPGWHAGGKVAWAGWTCEGLMSHTRSMLFPLYSTLYTRAWVRLLGVKVDKRTEISTAVGLSPLVTLGARDFVSDDVVFNAARSRDGWLHLERIEAGDGVFFGNGALVGGGTRLGNGSLVGAQTVAPRECPADASFFGDPALEFPRPAPHVDPSRTVAPSTRLVALRAVMDAFRILLPTTASAALGISVFKALILVGRHFGVVGVILATPGVLMVAGVAAVLLTAAAKWVLIGRYRPGEHPLWSTFVWRDEIINSCQEVLAGSWLLDHLLGTPLMGWYLRLMGARVGDDVWCDTLTITEFDVVTIGQGAVMNRRSCVESHLFHDRVMAIGPIDLRPRSSIGPSTAVLPDCVLGEDCAVSGRSIVLRGEELPAGTRWHGAPVVAR